MNRKLLLRRSCAQLLPAALMKVTGVVLWLILTAATLIPVACEPGPPPTERCDTAIDEDGDLRAGCDDPDCWVAGGLCPEVCDTAFDEDGDERIACADEDCWVAGGLCAEDCESGDDEDADGKVGCADSDCWVLGGVCEELCDSEDDEDGDGAVGCLDSSCWVAGGVCEEVCLGENDEDGDGMVDCEDTEDCYLDLACAPHFYGEVEPILLEHCGECHTGEMSLGGLNFDSYDDILKPSIYCVGETKGWCSIFRIIEKTMPQNCPGCVPQEDVEILQYWVEAGTPE